jgi:hypothetical protein
MQRELRHAGVLFWGFVDFVLAWIAYALRWLREAMAGAGVPPAAEKALLAAAVVLIVVFALRLLPGILRVLFAAAVALLVARALGIV